LLWHGLLTMPLGLTEGLQLSMAVERAEETSGRGLWLTPGITRRPEPLEVYDRRRVGGRVHAVVGRRAEGN